MSDPDARLRTQRLKPPSVYREDTTPLGARMRAKLLTYGVSIRAAKDHGWRQHDNELVMPVRSPYGEVRGHVTRTFDTPKRCYTYKATAQPWLDWWTGNLYKVTVVVEDCISALRLYGLGYNAVALLGTSITTEQAKEIENYSRGADIYLALDRDAFDKALHLTRKHSHILRMRPICLDEDIKNMKNDDDIHKLFEG